MLIIDGYNALFQYFRGGYRKAKLEAQRDEFLQVLEDYCTGAHKNALVFFDAEKAGEPHPVKHTIKRGTLSVIFTPINTTADDAIIEYMGEVTDKRSFKVITSDRVILNAADKQHIPTQTSENFIDEVERFLETTTSPFDKEKAEGISKAEVDYWMNIFGLDDKTLRELLDE
jgi:predicted RNA-binding protein with PIN domain